MDNKEETSFIPKIKFILEDLLELIVGFELRLQKLEIDVKGLLNQKKELNALIESQAKYNIRV